MVAIQIFGHEHVDTFRLIGKTGVGLTAPSMSTAYPRTNPTVRFWHQQLADSSLGGTAAGAVVSDYDQYIMDLLRSNAQHRPIFNHTYSFQKEYGMPDLSRSSFESLLARFSMDSHIGEPGWGCSAQISAAIFVPGRSTSQKDPGFEATKANCSEACAGAAGCRFWLWGHTFPDFTPPNAWCYLLKECGTFEKDTSGSKYHPKYSVSPMRGSGGVPLLRGNATSYARERRFFLSSTPTAIQPLRDEWCQMQDLCDKLTSGNLTTDSTFTQCLEDNGRAFVPPAQ